MYIGNDLQIAHPSYKIIDDISSGFNGSTTSFALQVSGATPVPFPISTQQVMISVNGVVQEPDPNGSAGFKLLGSNIVFSSAPANGHAFFGVINAGADYVTAGSEFPDGSATAPSFTFQDDQDTGWYRNASGDVGYSSNGSAILNFDGNGLTIAAGKGLTVDTSTLKVDATNNRVGINSASPTETLHVYQNATDNVNALFEQGTSNSGNLIQFKQTTTGSVARTAYIGHGGDNTGLLMLQNSAGIYLQTGGSNTALTLDSSQNAWFTQKVGVNQDPTLTTMGATSGTWQLPEVDGSTIGAELRVGDVTNNSVGIIRLASYGSGDDSGGGAIMFTNTRNGSNSFNSDIAAIKGSRESLGKGYLRFFTGNQAANAERMVIMSDGKIGIGDTAPDALLSIKGDSNGDSNPSIRLKDGTDTRECWMSNVSGDLYLAAGGNDNAYHTRIRLMDGNAIYMETGGTNALSLDSSQNATFAGNITTSSGALGIGDTTPNYEIHVKGADASPQLRLESSDGTGSKRADLFLDGAKAIFGANQSAQSIAFQTGYTDRLTIANNGSVTAAGTVSDSKGNLRSIPLNEETSAYTLVAADAGKAVYISSGGVTVANSVFAVGDAVTIINNSGSDQTITQGSGVTIYNTADATTGNRTLAGRGMCTLYFVATGSCYISGAGLS